VFGRAFILSKDELLVCGTGGIKGSEIKNCKLIYPFLDLKVE